MGLSVKGGPKRALMRRTNRSHVGRPTAVELHAVEPQLDIVEEVEHSDPHPMVVRCVAHLEEAFAAIDPRQWVTGAVELWKLELVEGLDVITGLVVVGVVTLRPTAVGGVVGVVDPVVQLCVREVDVLDRRGQGVLLGVQFSGRSLERRHLLLEWGQDLLDVVQATVQAHRHVVDGGEHVFKLDWHTLADFMRHGGESDLGS
jgi:hypothetical protein